MLRSIGDLLRAARRLVAIGCLALPIAAPAAAATLTIAQNFDPQTLWPNSSTASDNLNAASAIVQPLFWLDPRSGRAEPLLATGYQLESPVSVLIRLRPGVKFTNGEPMDAEAVVHSVAVFTDAKQTPAYANFAVAIDHAEKVDDTTVRLRMKFAYPPLQLLLTQIFITPPKYWDAAGRAGFGQKPVGTGPFRLVEWVRDDRLVMERNPDYWGTPPEGIDRLVFKPVPDETARVAGLSAGEYDIAKSVPISAIAQVQAMAGIDLLAVPSYRIFQLVLYSTEMHPGPLQDQRVRLALNYGIDKQAIINDLFFGQAGALHGQILRPSQPGYDPSLQDYPYDPARAKALLAEAGYPNGFEIGFKFPVGRYAQDQEVAGAIAGMLAKIGVRTHMTSIEPGEFVRQMGTGELGPMAFMGFAPSDDPDFQLSLYRSDWRFHIVKNTGLDALIDAGRREMDPDKRAAIYRQAMQLMHEDVPIVFLYVDKDFYGVTRRLKGFLPRGDGCFFFYGTSLDKP